MNQTKEGLTFNGNGVSYENFRHPDGQQLASPSNYPLPYSTLDVVCGDDRRVKTINYSQSEFGIDPLRGQVPKLTGIASLEFLASVGDCEIKAIHASDLSSHDVHRFFLREIGITGFKKGGFRLRFSHFYDNQDNGPLPLKSVEVHLPVADQTSQDHQALFFSNFGYTGYASPDFSREDNSWYLRGQDVDENSGWQEFIKPVYYPANIDGMARSIVVNLEGPAEEKVAIRAQLVRPSADTVALTVDRTIRITDPDPGFIIGYGASCSLSGRLPISLLPDDLICPPKQNPDAVLLQMERWQSLLSDLVIRPAQ